MIRIVTRLIVSPRNRGTVTQNAKRLVEFFEKHGVKSEGVFENFHESEVVHLWSAPSIAAYEQATAVCAATPRSASSRARPRRSSSSRRRSTGVPSAERPHIDLLDREVFANGQPHDAFRWLREHDPVHWHAEPDGGPGFFAVTRYEDVRDGRARSGALLVGADDPDPRSAARA